ncbi:MAG TPA: CpXC domain-containing protein [Armatimonadota bacterium]|nr:CpXC domain-containing protein [Armatimonadota bacterium]
MSQLKSHPVTCASCGKQFQARLWSSINVTLHPQLEALFLSGRLNLLTCPHCSTTSPAVSSLLYHDMEAPRVILALPEEDRGCVEEAKRALRADFEETQRSLGGGGAAPQQFAEPEVVLGYGALFEAITTGTKAAPRPAPAPASAATEARRERLRQFSAEDVRRLTRGLDLVSEAVRVVQMRTAPLRSRAEAVKQFLAHHWFGGIPTAEFAERIYQWLGNFYLYGWLDARALWQRRYVATGQPPSVYLDWLAALSEAEVEETLRINEAAATAEVEAAQQPEALRNWRAGRLETQFRWLTKAKEAVRRQELRPVLSDVAWPLASGIFEGDVPTLIAYAHLEKQSERAYSEGFAEGILIESFLAEAGLPPEAGPEAGPEAAPEVASAETHLPPKPMLYMTVREYLESQIKRAEQAPEGETAAAETEDLLTASRQKERAFTCPGCGYESPVRLWSAVNIATDSHLRAILRAGKIHQLRCAGCGRYSGADSLLQYHDPQGPLLVQVYPTRYQQHRDNMVSELETVVAYIQGLPAQARPKRYPAHAVVLFGMKDFADFLRAREPDSPPLVVGRSDGEKLTTLNKETFALATANLDSSIQAWRDVVTSSPPLQRLVKHRVWYVVRGAAERARATRPLEAAVEKVGLAVGTVCVLGFDDGRLLHHYEWARRGAPPPAPGPWLAAFTDPEIVHAVHREQPAPGDQVWSEAFGRAPATQAWVGDFLASPTVRDAVDRVRDASSSEESAAAVAEIAQQAYERALAAAMLLVSWLRGT